MAQRKITNSSNDVNKTYSNENDGLEGNKNLFRNYKKEEFYKHRSVVLNIDHLTSDSARNSTIYSATSVAGTSLSRSGRYKRRTFREMLLSNPLLLFRHGSSCLYFCFIFLVIVCAAVQFVTLSRGHNTPWMFRDRVNKITKSFQNKNSEIQSQLNILLNSLSHWCQSEVSTIKCNCTNPLIPQSRLDHDGWQKAHNLNMQMIRNYLDQQHGYESLDVVFLGDSIMEQWNGRYYGKNKTSLNDTHTIFQNYFQKSVVSTAPLEGLALGIAGDTTSNLLWRLQNGEIPPSLNPKVWWLLIGINDIKDQNCRPEVVTLGIQRILQELNYRHPESIIIVNGILPASLRPDGRLITPPSQKNKNNKNQTDGNDDDKIQNLWPYIQQLNKDLRNFCRHKKYVYVDSSNVFVAKIGNANFQREEKLLMKELMDDFIHPTALGYQYWAKEIVHQLQTLLEPDTFND